MRIFLILFLCLGFGGLLAWSWSFWPIWPGAIGGTLLVLTAVFVRWRWDRRRASGEDEPGPYERRAWHSMASMAVLSGHLGVALCLGLDIHVGRGNSLAIDDWFLVLGAVVGWLVMRPRSMLRDERDREMADRGAHVGFRLLIGLLIGLLLLLGFAPVRVTEHLTPFVLGNMLVVAIQLGLLGAYTVQLVGYRAASRPEAVDG